MASPVLDGLLVTFGGTLDRLLRGEARPAQHLPHRGDADADVEHPPDQRADPREGPALILAPTGRGRTLVQFRDQFLHQFP